MSDMWALVPAMFCDTSTVPTVPCPSCGWDNGEHGIDCLPLPRPEASDDLR